MKTSIIRAASRPSLLLLAGMAVSAASAAQGPPPHATPPRAAAAATDPQAIQGVVVLEKAAGEIRALPLGSEAPEDWKQIASWVWSPEAPPQRLRPDQSLPSNLPPATSWLTVKLDRRAPCGRGPARLVAAPAEMYSEVPEGRLPWTTLKVPTGKSQERRVRVPRSPSGWLRLRLACQGAGSWWQDVEPGVPEVTILPVPASDRTFVLSLPAGREATVGAVALFDGSRRVLAHGEGATGERLTFPQVPAAHPVALLAWALGYTTKLFEGEIGSLPTTIHLELGQAIRGRLVDPKGNPVLKASIALEAWLDGGHGFLTNRRTTSDAQGRFEIKGLPPCRSALAIDAHGFARRVERVELTSQNGVDLGTLTLVPGQDLAVEVVDGDGMPISEAEIRTKDDHRATTDAEGRAELTGLDPAAAQVLTATHEGYLDVDRDVRPPLPQQIRLTLRQAFIVRGRLLSEGVPVEGGSAEWKIGRRFDSQALEAGRFRLALKPDSEIELTLRSASTLPLVKHLDPGAAGEERDLGDLEAPQGETVVGVVVSAASGDPVPGAVIWMPRPRPGGAAVALLLGDRVEARTGADGSFRLTGVPRFGGQARVQAAGFAPLRVSVPPVAVGEVGDLGTLEISPGSTLVVTLHDPVDRPAQARVDPTGTGVNLDLITAPVVDGVARIEHVPAGRVLLSVMEGYEEICRRTVRIPREAGESYVDCGTRMRVSGLVTVGGNPAGAGILRWVPDNPSAEPGAIFTRYSRLGVRDQQVWGPLSGGVHVPVGADGAFVTESLYAGPWSVFWNPDAGGQLGPIELAVPEADSFETPLAFAGQVIRGWTLDPNGDPVPGARVRETAGGRMTFSGDDGRFELPGLAPGFYDLTARKDDLASPVTKVSVSVDEAPEPVTLVLGRDDDNREVVVSVIDADGRPAPGAFAFLESAHGIQLLTADVGGHARAVFDPPLPETIRAAAFANGQFALGEWVTWKDRSRGLQVQLEKEGGGLRIQSDKANGQIEVSGPGGWNLTRLSWLLGRPLFVEPGEALTLAGLPGGSYAVGIDKGSVLALVQGGKIQKVDLP